MMDFRKSRQMLRPTPNTMQGIRKSITLTKQYLDRQRQRYRKTSQYKHIHNRIIQLQQMLIKVQKNKIQLNNQHKHHIKNRQRQQLVLRQQKQKQQNSKTMVEQLQCRYRQKTQMIHDDRQYLRQLKNTQSQIKKKLQYYQANKIQGNSKLNMHNIQHKSITQHINNIQNQKLQLTHKIQQIRKHKLPYSELQTIKDKCQSENNNTNALTNTLQNIQQQLWFKGKLLSDSKTQQHKLQSQLQDAQQSNKCLHYKLMALKDKLNTLTKDNSNLVKLKQQTQAYREQYREHKQTIQDKFKQQKIHIRLSIQHSKRLLLGDKILIC